MNRIVARLFTEYLDSMAPDSEFTIMDFQDYVRIRAPRHVPSNSEVSRLTAYNPRITKADKVGRWVAYRVVA